MGTQAFSDTVAGPRGTAAPPLLVVMGVSGSGKSTVGARLAERLDMPFKDADDLHPESNVAKMSVGIPLTDEDRWPWLALVGDALGAASETGLVMACSALRRSYREAILAGAPGARFVHLEGGPELLMDRMAARVEHFMPAALLRSQFETLEPLAANEPGVTVDVAAPVAEIVRSIIDNLSA